MILICWYQYNCRGRWPVAVINRLNVLKSPTHLYHNGCNNHNLINSLAMDTWLAKVFLYSTICFFCKGIINLCGVASLILEAQNWWRLSAEVSGQEASPSASIGGKLCDMYVDFQRAPMHVPGAQHATAPDDALCLLPYLAAPRSCQIQQFRSWPPSKILTKVTVFCSLSKLPLGRSVV